MLRGISLKDNIEFLLFQYKKELDIEESKDILEQDLEIINCYKNIILELEYALEISK